MGTTINVNTPAVYAPYLDWAYIKSDHMGLWQKAGIKTIFYTSPLQAICTVVSSTGSCITGDAGYNLLNTGGAYNSVAAKDCSGNLIKGSYGANKYPVLFLDPTKPGATSYIQAVEDNAVAYMKYANPGYTHAWNQIFIDNDGPGLYNPSATPCGLSAATWIADTAAEIGGTTDGPYQVNALGIDNIPGVQQALPKLNATNIVSGDYEECYGGNTPADGVFKAGVTANWLAVEYAEINTIAQGKTFWCYVRISGDGASYIPWRIYTTASFLLSYDYNHAVIEESLSGGASGLNVFPEWHLVPSTPLTTESDVSGYQLPSGLYLRQFAQCYYKGSLVGPCAVAVNPSPTLTVPVPAGYTRSLTVSGDGVLDGGTATITQGAPASLGPATAAFLFP